MSTAPTLSPGAVYASLTLAGKDSLDRLKTAHEEHRAAQDALEVATSALHATVFDALQSKVPARFVADQLGISLSRVYQIRDDVSRYRALDT